MKLYEYAQYDALGLRELLKTGEISVAELCALAQSGIDILNPKLNFLVARCLDRTSAALADYDNSKTFSGVPFLIKDAAGMAGVASTFGTRLLPPVMPVEDSEIIRRFCDAGLITLGATNIPEVANSTTTESLAYGPARNPWDLQRSVGGSSGGAASAVAAGIVPMAHGTDGAGSIRTPAHCCGVFGLAPSRGRVPCGPASYGGSFGTLRQHVLTRSVRDSAAMLDAIQGPEPGALFRMERPDRSYADSIKVPPDRLRIAISTTSPSGKGIDASCIAAVEIMARECAALGHSVEYAEPNYCWETFSRAFADVWSLTFNFLKTSARHAGVDLDPQLLERSTWLTVQHGSALTGERLYNSFRELHGLCRTVELFFDHWDILLSPVCLTPAPSLGEIDSNSEQLTSFPMWFDAFLTNFSAFTPIFNASGQPAMSIPASTSTDGLPVGVQFAARIGDEVSLLQLAAQLEVARPWTKRIPPISLHEYGN